MKTEKQIIDELGEWLCKDLERELTKANLPFTELTEKLGTLHKIAERIQWYRDNEAGK